jgi:hypothetical protein
MGPLSFLSAVDSLDSMNDASFFKCFLFLNRISKRINDFDYNLDRGCMYKNNEH